MNDTGDVLQARAYKIDQISYLAPIRIYRKDPPWTPFDDELEIANITARKSKCRHTPAVNQDTSLDRRSHNLSTRKSKNDLPQRDLGSSKHTED